MHRVLNPRYAVNNWFASAVVFVLGAWFLPTGDAWLKLPKRCCTPDTWEADIRNMGSTTRLRDPYNEVKAKFSYDFANGRWALDYIDPNPLKSRHIIFDHPTNSRIAIFHEGCFRATTDSEMERYCIPENTTYHGQYNHPGQSPSLDYDIWTYEHFFLPIRTIIKVSRDRCLPLQDSSYALFRNHWRWYEGNPECNPWMFPEKSVSGECFKCHSRITVEKAAARPGAFLGNMDFRNVNLTITNHEIFKVPDDCQQVDDWPSTLKWPDFWRVFLMRRKMT